jgi:beta-glucosidase
VPESYKAGDSLKLSVTVKNTGSIRGDEVVQVYVKHLDNKVKAPLRSLAAFQRITTEPGQSKQISLWIAPDAFATYGENGAKNIVPGQFEIAVGGGQPDVRPELPSMKAKVTVE